MKQFENPVTLIGTIPSKHTIVMLYLLHAAYVFFVFIVFNNLCYFLAPGGQENHPQLQQNGWSASGV